MLISQWLESASEAMMDGVNSMKDKCRWYQTTKKKKKGKRSTHGNPLRQTDRETKENGKGEIGERRRTYEVKRTETEAKELNE